MFLETLVFFLTTSINKARERRLISFPILDSLIVLPPASQPAIVDHVKSQNYFFTASEKPLRDIEQTLGGFVSRTSQISIHHGICST
jgi:hypothetical protein